MAEIGDLTIAVSARTADAKAGLRGVRSELDDLDGDALTAAGALEQTRRSTDDLARSSVSLTGALAGVAAAASRADDTVEEAGDSAGRSAGSFAVLAATVRSSAISFTILSGATASAALGLTTVGAALAAVTVAAVGLLGVIGALAGAFGLLLGAGVVTHMGELRRELGRVIPQIKAALEPLGEVFGPLLVGAVRRLDDLVENVVEAIGGTERFASTLRQLGQFAFEIIPAIAGAMFEIARLALPALLNGLEFLRSNGPAAFETIRETARELLPELKDFTLALADITPELLDIGTALVDTVLPAFTTLINALATFLEITNAVPYGDIAAGFTLIALSIAGISTATVLATGKILALAAVLTGLIKFAEFALGTLATAFSDLTGQRQATERGPPPTPGDRGQVTAQQETPGTNIRIESINANSRSEGRAAGRGLKAELNTLDTSRVE